ncbi:hypothetical protein ACQP00_23985 [Dactylosporangium sp. CS-047395]|uniref:hypothetical protein n=1 Tax=Dactylosporangium sp. CS-047395 TaxID=3239936 RepID=UPI003D8A7380
MGMTASGRRVAVGCGLAAVALLAAAYAATAATMIVAVAALALAGVLTQLSGTAPRRDRMLLPLAASVALSSLAALYVVWAAVTPEGPIPCVGPSSAARLGLATACAAQLVAAGVVLRAANRDRGGASWRAYLRLNPRIAASLAVALHLAAPAATFAVLAGATACHLSHTRLLDTVAAGTVAAAIAAVDLLLAARLVGLATLAPARPVDTDGIELALLAADIRSVAQLTVVHLAHDELMVTARVGLPAGADVPATLHRARAHIQDFVPTARHIYLRPESPH